MAKASKPKGLQGQYAGFVSRAIAFVVDILIVIAIVAVINGAMALTLDFFLGIQVGNCPPIDLSARVFQSGLLCHAANWTRVFLTIVTPPVYFGLFWTLGGQTLGQYAMGLRVVRLDGRRMTFWRSLIRWAGYFVSFLALGLGYLWVLWDDRRQGFMDKIAKTVVVYSWEAKQNEFLLDRIRHKLIPQRKKADAIQGSSPALSAKSARLELVLATFSTMAKVRAAMGVLQDSMANGAFQIVNSVVMVKDETGALGYVGTSDLAAGDRSVQSAAVLAGDPRLKQINAEQLTADLPNGSFILLIIVEDKNLTLLLKTLTAAKVAANVFDLDTPAHPPMTLTPGTAHPVQSAGMTQSSTGPGSALPQDGATGGTAGFPVASILAGEEQP